MTTRKLLYTAAGMAAGFSGKAAGLFCTKKTRTQPTAVNGGYTQDVAVAAALPTGKKIRPHRKLSSPGYLRQIPRVLVARVYNAGNPLRRVGAPGKWERLVPIWGPGKAAAHEFGRGAWGWGTLHTVEAVSDAYVLKSLGTSIGKGCWKFGGSHSWRATQEWAVKHGWRKAPEHELHHWLIWRNGWVGRHFPNWLKNQPWNLMSIDGDLHIAIHHSMNIPQRLWYGTPTWFKAVVSNLGGTIANGFKDKSTCKRRADLSHFGVQETGNTLAVF